MLTSWLRLAGRTAIVTGAASGIGSAVARSLACEGCNVVLADVSETDLQREVAWFHEVLKASARVSAVTCDVTDRDAVRHLVGLADGVAASESDVDATSVREAVDGISVPPTFPLATILVNCAGITSDALLTNMTTEQFDRVIDVNLKGSWMACKYFCDASRLERLKQYHDERRVCLQPVGGASSLFLDRRSLASIVNISSVVARTGNVGQTNYAASKGGIIGLTRALAKEMAQYGVRANAILPGFVDTPMTKAIPERIQQQLKEKIALGEFGKADDIANLALFLSSNRSGYITGECLECSGMTAL